MQCGVRGTMLTAQMPATQSTRRADEQEASQGADDHVCEHQVTAARAHHRQTAVSRWAKVPREQVFTNDSSSIGYFRSDYAKDVRYTRRRVSPVDRVTGISSMNFILRFLERIVSEPSLSG